METTIFPTFQPEHCEDGLLASFRHFRVLNEARKRRRKENEPRGIGAAMLTVVLKDGLPTG